MSEELRLDFSDYSSEQQEADYNRYLRLKEKYRPYAYLLKVDGTWASLTLTPNTYRPNPKFYENRSLIETYQEFREKHPEHRVKYIINEGLENYLRDIRKKELAQNKLQKMLDFNRGKEI